MSDYQSILKSFKTKKTLNPKVWNNPENPKDSVLKTEVREALLKIADEFSNYLGDDVFLDDVVLTGSLSNYNWSEFSDFDLHLIIDFNQFEDNSELYQKLFDMKRQVFNDKHDIKIYGYDVELYAQSTVEKHFSAGEYSVQDNEWIKIPKKQELVIDEEILKNKIDHWNKSISNALSENNSKKLEKLKEKLKKFRQCGIEEKGEFSYENLVFKYLRRSGAIKKLFDGLNKTLDKELSVENNLMESENENSIMKMISNLLKSLGIKDKESARPVVKNFLEKNDDVQFKGNLSYLDLDSENGFNAYKEICQEFIDSRNPNAGVTGEMMALAAKKFMNQGYIPPELALAQIALEGGLSKNEKNRPRKTNNPFNVGNVDSGKNRYFDSVQSGVDAYYNLVTKNYLSKDKKPEQLLSNYVNLNNRRYASDPTYESKLKKLVSSISSVSAPIVAKYRKEQSSLT